MKTCISLLLLSTLQLYAANTNLVGNSGLVVIPSAYIMQDSHCRLSHGQLLYPHTYLDESIHDELFYNCSIGFLPFVELMFGVINPKGREWGIGDRTASIRVQLLRENKKRPALLIGTQDPFGAVAQDWAQRMNALYLSASKSVSLPYFHQLQLHYGYGVDWLKAGVHYLKGSFGGMELFVVPQLGMLAEYDGDKVNLGVRGKAYNAQLLLVWLDGRSFTGCVSYQFSLR